jgi:CHAP domain
MERVAQIQSLLQPAPVQTAAPVATTSATAADTSFASQLQTAGGTPLTMTPSTGGTSAGQAIVKIAEGEVGVAEQPPGSNDSPRIAQYRQATAGSGVGPWCAYFASWAARQAGVPLGDHGQGFGAVSSVWSWAQQTHRAMPAGSKPAPGDLIVWGGQHIGIVESVDADGKIHTIEGNSSNMVTRRTHDSSGDGATGYVRLG